MTRPYDPQRRYRSGDHAAPVARGARQRRGQYLATGSALTWLAPMAMVLVGGLAVGTVVWVAGTAGGGGARSVAPESPKPVTQDRVEAAAATPTPTGGRLAIGAPAATSTPISRDALAAPSPTSRPGGLPLAASESRPATQSTTSAQASSPTGSTAASSPGTATGSSSSNVPGITVAGARSWAEPFTAYTVQPGDTLRFVAGTYGVSSASIAVASGLRDPDALSVGEVLTIPREEGWLYRLRPGETLDQVAASYGVPVPRVLGANFLSDPAAARPGEVLLIPNIWSTAGASK